MKGIHMVLWRAAMAVCVFIVHNSSAQSGYTVTERGPDWKVLQKTTVEHGTNRVHKYTELATGMNYTNAYGQLVESKEQITILPNGGAAAEQGRHKVYFPANIYNGVIEVVTPDGRHLKSRPLGVSYDDGSNTVFIAELKSAVGYLTSSNTVTYRDAFTGFKADLVCQYRRGGFECDLVFRQQPPTPDQYGLDNSFSTLSMVTEFFDTADPQQINASYDDYFGLQDTTLKFGKLTMTHGKAFGIKTTNSASSTLNAATVYKSWVHAEGRTFLIETVPVVDIAEDLDALPLTARLSNPKSSIKYLASSRATFPPAHEVTADTNQILLASSDFRNEPGVVLDYNTIDADQTDYTFAGGETYYISDSFHLSGTATFEAGTVVKCAPGGFNLIFEEGSAVVCQTTEEQPAILTSKNDNTLGQPISGSTGSPEMGTPYMSWNGDAQVELKHLRFYYGGIWAGFFHAGFCDMAANDLQIHHAWTGIGLYGGHLTAHNVLMVDTAQAFFLDGTPADVEHLTLDQSMNSYKALYSNEGDSRTFALTNSLLIGVDDTQFAYYPLVTNAAIFVATNTGLFKTAANANYYLVTNSPYRNVGTTDIDTNLLAELQTMTTYAPQDGGFPDTNAPDLGYHYPVNEDSDHDGLPDWWEWHWFGNFAHIGTETDTSGNTLLSDYDNYASGTVTNDPNIIAFSIESTNDFVNHTNVSVQLDITGGVPSYYAIFVNNSTTTNWLTFTGTNLTVNLGATDGVYNVVVGLKGLASEATVTWRDYAFYLDRVSPAVKITNPTITGGVGTTVIKPYLQLQGLADEPLYSLSYDISNAVAVLTNQDAFVHDQYFDTNKFDFTTNYFQAYDVPLATNGNAITLRVTDRAGNVTTTNFNVVLNYTSATNPPVVKLLWPEDNMAISGTNFTLRGTMSDETGSVVAQITDNAGNTNVLAGLVERNGMFWVENLPLTTNGDNTVTIMATDAAGNMTVTNIVVFESEVKLTIDSTPTGDALYKPTGSVSGTVSEESWEVYVNGMRVNVDTNENSQGTYNWASDNVPIYGRGTATFDAVALPSGAAPPPANANVSVEMEPYWCVVDYTCAKTYSYHGYLDYEVVSDSLWENYSAQATAGTDGKWHETYTGYADQIANGFHEGWGYTGSSIYNWSDTNAVGTVRDIIDGQVYYDGPLDGPLPVIPDMDQTWVCGSCGWGYEVTWMTHYYADNVSYQWKWPHSEEEVSVGAFTRVKLYTGGKAGVKRDNLFSISVSADEYFKPPGTGEGVWWYTPQSPIDSKDLIVAGKTPGADGKVWVVLPDNSEQDITVHAPGIKHFNAIATPTKYKLRIKFADKDVTDSNSSVIVGQLINPTCGWEGGSGPEITNFVWTVPGITFSNYEADDNVGKLYTDFCKTNSGVSFYWVDGGSKQVSCDVMVMGQSLTAQTTFDVKRPTSQITAWGGQVGIRNYNGHYQLYLGDQVFDAAGMNFGGIVNVPAPFSGSNQWVQLVTYSENLQTNNGSGYWTSNASPANVLDTYYPYPPDNGFTGADLYTWTTTDSPHSVGLDNYAGVVRSDSFQMWLMFKPPDGQWVPLRKIAWNWNGTGTYSSSTGWHSSCTLPSPNIGNDTDSTTHPIWTTNVVNYFAKP